jgi:cytochrome c biogenesis protein CcdA
MKVSLEKDMKKRYISPRFATKWICFLILVILLLSPASGSAVLAESRLTGILYRGIENPVNVFLTESIGISSLSFAQEFSFFPASREVKNKHLERISPVLLFVAGILAGFNPCLLAVMAFLASIVLVQNGRRKEMLKITCGFSAGIFAMYMLAGVGIFSVVNLLPGIQRSFTEIAIIVTASLGFWHIYDAYRLKKHARSTFRTPDFLKNFMGSMSEKNFLLLSFLSGGMFSLVKAPCVGAIYLSLLSILATKTDIVRGTIYMGIYNIGLLLPVIGLGLLLALGLSPKKVTEFREKWRVEIRLTTGFILIFLAILIQLEII